MFLRGVSMIRLFDQHVIRFQKELEGYWDFTPIASKDSLPLNYDYKMMVPGCWENNIKFYDYRGYGVYKKNVTLEKDSNIRLVFKGVSHTADIYLDGKHIAHHYNAFTEFSKVVANVKAGEHEIHVIADNSFSEESSLHKPNDYYCYGGIIRPVVMETVPNVFIKRVQFTPVLENEKWNAEIEVNIENIANQSHKVKVSLNLDELSIGNDILNQWIEIEPTSEKTVKVVVAFDEIEPWIYKNPKLYMLKSKLYCQGVDLPVDDLIERVGFRTIKIIENEMLFNNLPVFIQGFNRHEDFNVAGCSIPSQLLSVDLDFMIDLGSNAVRTSHYPNDERFLDMCDERGILVWEENHARGLGLSEMMNPNFEKQCEDCNREMVLSHYNHPCIIMWGILNECDSTTDEGRRMYSKQFAQIKSLDQSRPLTFASNKYFKDICFDLVDIVSVNIYHGWYGEDRTVEQIEKSYMKLYEWIQSAKGRNKPIIISEFGAGALYGCRAPHRPKWSEERQLDIIKQSLSVYLNRPEIIGTYIWQFADCRVTDEIWGIKRPRGLNNKGIVDEYRRPKLAYHTVKEIYENNIKVW